MSKGEGGSNMGEAIKRLVRGQMARKDIEYKELASRLREYGVDLSESSLRTKINTGILSAQVFSYILMALEKRDAIVDLKNLYDDIGSEVICPKCKVVGEKSKKSERVRMMVVSFKGVEIERCLKCHGMWFDQSERERVGELHQSESVDIGTDKVGKLMNEVLITECPKCDGQLKTKIDEKTTNIKYEECEKCMGIFMDGGEFRTYKTYYLTSRNVTLLADE